MFDILIAEDNPVDVLMVEEALKAHAVTYRLWQVETGEQFLAWAEAACEEGGAPKPDLIILDWMLPKGSGAELIRGIRKTDRCANSLLFVMTSSISPHDEAAAIEAGANRFISKPADLNEYLELGAMIARELNVARSQSA